MSAFDVGSAASASPMAWGRGSSPFSLSALAQGRWAELRDREWPFHPIVLPVSGIFGWYPREGLLA